MNWSAYNPDNVIEWLLLLVVAGMSVYAAMHALLTKRDSIAALGWVAFTLVLPLVGPFIYLVFGINRIREAAQEKYHPTTVVDRDETFFNPSGSNLRPYSLVGETVTGNGLHSCDEIRLLENGEQNFKAMLEDIEQAERRIYLSTYIFQGDKTGKQFLTALNAARNRGIEVKVIVDGLGGAAYPPGLINELHGSEVEFELFNPLTLIPPSLHINMRNHRKILIVDGNCAYTGGQNISTRHLVDLPNNPKCARDLHFRLTGKIVDDLERAFLTDWNHCTNKQDRNDFKADNVNRSESETWTRLILDGPNETLDQLNEVLVGMFAIAKKRIWIMTPYFLPGPDLVGALQGATLRGVDVKVLLPERTNIHLAHYAAQHNLRHILAKDISVYLQPAPFVHTKAILIDDRYGLIGSANLDPRSLRLNFELGVEVFSQSFAAQMAEYFHRHIDQARKVDEEELRRVPLPLRIRNALAWLFSPYL